jgi:hypothetical protein
MAHVDTYLFPCRGKDATSQVNELFSCLSGVKFGQVWLDIETNPSDGCGWGTDYSSNCDYIGEMLRAVESHGVRPGVYAR